MASFIGNSIVSCGLLWSIAVSETLVKQRHCGCATQAQSLFGSSPPSLQEAVV